jgi:hypothetical protein
MYLKTLSQNVQTTSVFSVLFKLKLSSKNHSDSTTNIGRHIDRIWEFGIVGIKKPCNLVTIMSSKHWRCRAEPLIHGFAIFFRDVLLETKHYSASFCG